MALKKDKKLSKEEAIKKYRTTAMNAFSSQDEDDDFRDDRDLDLDSERDLDFDGDLDDAEVIGEIGDEDEEFEADGEGSNAEVLDDEDEDFESSQGHT